MKAIKKNSYLIIFVLILTFLFISLSSNSLIANSLETEDFSEVEYDDIIIDLEYQETDIKDVIRSLAVAADVNIIVDDSAQGEVTVQLQAVTFQEAFSHLLKIKDLDYHIDGNLVIVAIPDRLEDLYQKTEQELYSLEHLDPEEAREVLGEVIPGLSVQTIADESRLILRGFSQQIADGKDFLAEIDTPRDKTHQIINLTEQSPEDIAEELEALFPDLTVRPRATTGDIIIQGRSKTLEEAKDFIKEIDVPDRDVEKIYRAQDLEARELAAEIEGMYPEDRLKIRVQNNLILLDGSPGVVDDVIELLEELDEKEEVKERRRIRVDYIDLEEMEEIVTGMEPDLEIQTSSGERALVIQGDESAVNRAEDLVAEMDQPRRQVMLDVRVEEISHSALRDRGIDPDQFRDFATIGVETDGDLPTGVELSIPDFRVFDEDDATQTLANPRLLALDGTEAELLIGDEIPYEVREVVDGEIETVGYEFAEVGINLNFTPTITRDDTITLDIEPEVNSILEMGTGLEPPSVQTRRFTNTISLKDGQTFAVGGLMQDEITREIRSLPFLSDLPILGRLFEYEREDQEETELIIFITTNIVDIMDDDDSMVQELSQTENIILDDDREKEELEPEDIEMPEVDEEKIEKEEEIRSDEFREELQAREDWPEFYEFEFTTRESLSAQELNDIYGTGIDSLEVNRQEDGSWQYQLKLKGEMVYELKEGETISDIAQQADLSVEEILEASWLSEEEVEAETTLILPFK